MRTNPATACHRTVLNAGYLDGIRTEQLNQIQKILTSKAENAAKLLLEIPYSSDPLAKPAASKRDFQSIDLNSIKNKDVREVGAE